MSAKTIKDVGITRVTPNDGNYFFGYYDKTPWDKKQNKILTHKTIISNRLPTREDLVEVGFINLENNAYVKIGSSNAWNFQQGAMLQWCDNLIIYNFIKNGKEISRIIDSKGKDLQELSFPIYSLMGNNKFASSVNFSRINEYRPGYGYFSDFEEKTKDGLWICDLEKNTKELLVDFKLLRKNKFLSASNSCWIDHILFSPNDNGFTFLLRYITSDGGVYSKLMYYNLKTYGLKCLLDTGMASHGAWYDDENFVIWGRLKRLSSIIMKNRLSKYIKKPINIIRNRQLSSKIRENIYGDCFLKIHVISGEKKVFAPEIPTDKGGGHFSFSRKNNIMLTDTDIDRNGSRSVFIYDLNKKTIEDIISLKTPTNIHRTGYRCDLHPRLSRDENSACIDSIHENFRGIYIIDLRNIIGG